ncbi:MAG: hypothetical protein OXC81_00795, partial [Betaproteobacteria bacterium]|nr:hypothetical protein [Betaproteobacteria bacterium]
LIGSALVLAAAAVLRIRLLADPWRSMASAAAITAVTIVNLCFINLSLVEPVDVQWPTLANNIYALIWTFFLAGFGWLAFSRNRRWAVNMVALFVLIHFFGQWFRRFDASALSLLVAGAALLAVAGVVYRLNCRRTDEVS